MTYEITFERNAKSFWDANKASLMAQESANNLPIGLLLGIVSGERTWRDLSLFSVKSEHAVVGQAVHAGGDKPMILTSMPPEASEALVEAAIERGFLPNKVRGPVDTAERCARLFAADRGGRVTLRMNQGIYELTKVIWPNDEGGRLVKAEMAHRDITLRYAESFVHECFPEEAHPLERAHAMVDRLLPQGQLFLWQTPDGEAVSMAARVRETPNTATLSVVYTPPQLRGRGYARSVVAHLSQRWLDRGKRACNLFTDLANPASNRAYTHIGYRKILESRTYEIEKTAAPK
jgi:hypothetical protein